MDRKKALALVNEAGKKGLFRLTSHADERMGSRGASWEDVRNALRTASSCSPQRGKETWVASGGRDTDGDQLDCVVAFESGVLVVTLY